MKLVTDRLPCRNPLHSSQCLSASRRAENGYTSVGRRQTPSGARYVQALWNPAGGLLTQNFTAVAVNRGLRMTDIADGMKRDVELGYFDQGQNNSLIVAEGGLAAI